MKFTIGADPELFFCDNNNKLISVIDLIGGSKHEPLQFAEGFGILEDNVAAEFNIPPATDSDGWNQNLKFALEYLQNVAANKGLNLSKVASGSFSNDQLEHPMALVFGCEPDFNAWTGRKNPRPSADDFSLRSCGGHVHLGFEFSSKQHQQQVIKLCDLMLGVPSVRMDTDTKRRELYGKAGSMRFKPYGAEYRTLSNFWIFEEGTRRWVHDQVCKVMGLMEQGFKVDHLQAPIEDCINKNDQTAYSYLMETFGHVIND